MGSRKKYEKTLVTAFALTTGILLSGCGTADESTEKAPEATEEVDLTAETDAYKKFALEQKDEFVMDTEKFVTAVKAGDIDEAKKIYLIARMYFERSEPIAERFGDFDPRIDALLADVQEKGQGAY